MRPFFLFSLKYELADLAFCVYVAALLITSITLYHILYHIFVYVDMLLAISQDIRSVATVSVSRDLISPICIYL